MDILLNQFIKYIKLDDKKRILISLNNQYEQYLKDKKTKVTIKKGIESILEENFVQLEIGKNICRITVKEGSEEKSLKLIETELVKSLQMAMSYINNMQNNKGS